jgi:hypothetical protein
VIIEPTRLYSHNNDVDEENERQLRKLGGNVVKYEATDTGRDRLLANCRRYDITWQAHGAVITSRFHESISQ